MPREKMRTDEHIEVAATTLIPSAGVPARRKRGVGIAGRSGPPGNGNAQTHGAFALKRAVRTLGSRTIDRRTKVGRALAAWCSDLAGDLGGADQLSTAQKALIEQAATTRLILDSIDGWLAMQPSLIDKRKRALLPVVRERQSLADALVRYLTTLGLQRVARELPDLQTYLATRTAEGRPSSLPERCADSTPERGSAPLLEVPPKRAELAHERRADPGAGRPIPGEEKAKSEAL